MFGILGGIGAHAEDVAHMKRTADRLFGDDYLFSVLGAGRNQTPVATQSLLLGGNVRVGLEDNLWLDKGVLATNAQLVERAVSIISNLGARVITPAEVRAKLKLEKRAPMGK